ncbi:putative transcription factor WD40-like family [Helianthus annuus]|nr:putative transcription factor WD40-like family [Helianthus annuus]
MVRFWFQKIFELRSERVKSIDLHPTAPWVLLGLHSGNVCIWNYQSQVTEKTFEIANSRVRSARFVARKEWIVIGADDGFIRVYNYNTMENIIEFKAHSDFIRTHPSHTYFPHPTTNILSYGIGRKVGNALKRLRDMNIMSCN